MKITVLAGGLSPERDVSLTTGVMAAQALRSQGHQVAVVDLFLGVEQPIEDMEQFFAQGGSVHQAGVARQAPDLLALKRQRRDKSPSRLGCQVLDICRSADIVFIGLHGADGENGYVQALLDLVGVKYTGSGPLGSGLAMDKAAAKLMFQAAGLRTPAGQLIKRPETAAADAELPQELPLPCFVKPLHGGSSVATTLVEWAEDLPAALSAVFACQDDALVEPYIKGREIQVGILGRQALPPIEIVCENSFFDYVMKYQAGACREICPAAVAPEVAAQLQAAALTAFNCLGLQVYSRADFIVDEQNRPWLLEINTLPGMTATSLVPQEAAVLGLSYAGLCQRIIDLSLDKYRD